GRVASPGVSSSPSSPSSKVSPVEACALSIALSDISSVVAWAWSALISCAASLSGEPSAPDWSFSPSWFSSWLSSSSVSALVSSPRSSADNRSCTRSPNLAWSSVTRLSLSSRAPILSSSTGRQRSTILRAAAGGGSPVSRSRTSIASASDSGASARSVISSNLPRWKWSSSMAVRFLATPAIRREPIASTRACSTASNTPRACGFPGISLRCTFGSWQASFSAIESAWPRTIAASRFVILRAGSGSRALPGANPGRSAAKVTSSSGALAIARRQDVTARLNGSVGASFDPVRNLMFDVDIASSPCRGDGYSAQRHVHRRFRQLDIEAALVELGDQRPFQFVAFVEEGEAERKADIAENIGVLGPGDHRARAHHRRQIAIGEGVAGEIGEPHHLVDDVAAFLAAIMMRLGKHDLDFLVMRQIVQRGDDRPAVHLALVDLLGPVIEAGRIAEADGVGGREQPKRRMWLDHLVLVEQRQPAGDLQHALDHEHHVGTAGIVFIEYQRYVVLQRPGQNAIAEFGDLLAVLDDDGILADQVDPADMAVEIDAHAGPVQPRRDLLDMRRLAGAVIARDHDT